MQSEPPSSRLLPFAWIPVRDGDPRARALYLRHYSANPRARPADRGNRARFAGPGEHLVLLSPLADALFIWRRQRYRLDAELGVNCSLFRNESAARSSDLIRAAAAIAWLRWPGQRLFTFVDPTRIRSSNPGYCFIAAGWTRLARTTRRHNLVILEVLPPC